MISPYPTALVALCLVIWQGESSRLSAEPAGPLGTPGNRALYLLSDTTASLAERPDFERQQRLSVVAVELRLGPAVHHDTAADGQWCSLTWWRLNGQRYQLWLLMDGWPRSDSDPQVAECLWLEPEWPDAWSYRHECSAALLLPRLPLWRYGWPQTHAGPRLGRPHQPVAGLPDQLWLHGWLFTRLPDDSATLAALNHRLGQVGEGAALFSAGLAAPPQRVTTLRLQPDLLIGWTPMDRDAAGRPYYRLPDQSYQYVPKTGGDLMADFNVFGRPAVTYQTIEVESRGAWPCHPTARPSPRWKPGAPATAASREGNESGTFSRTLFHTSSHTSSHTTLSRTSNC